MIYTPCSNIFTFFVFSVFHNSRYRLFQTEKHQHSTSTNKPNLSLKMPRATPSNDDDYENSPVQKTILSLGNGSQPDYPDQTKVYFHYLAKICSSGKVLDDSRKLSPIRSNDCCKSSKPMELIFGKGFKLPVWEKCLSTMCVGEVSKFVVRKDLVDNYPMVSSQFRSIAQGKTPGHHCAMTLATTGIGSEDLDGLLKNPEDLEFTFEMVKVELPETYQQESWLMNDKERLQYIPTLKEQGNVLFKSGDIKGAIKKYHEALHLLDQFTVMEKPGCDEFIALDNQKTVFHLNLAQCDLLNLDFRSALFNCSEVLSRDPDNVKGLYRKMKAHIGNWDVQEAHDLAEKLISSDEKLRPSIEKDLALFKANLDQKKLEESAKLKGKLVGAV